MLNNSHLQGENVKAILFIEILIREHTNFRCACLGFLNLSSLQNMANNFQKMHFLILLQTPKLH